MLEDTAIAAGEAAADCWTRREIAQQPVTLGDTYALLRAQRDGIAAFLAPLLADPATRIVLTGAGTSAFIGECLAPWLSRVLGRCVEAIATTDLVSAPDLHFRRTEPTLLVSFGRSGSSPESVAAIEIADAAIDTVRHLVITCNPAGTLARRNATGTLVVVLPEATHDRGFAMTSSFTAMMFAALAMFSGIDALEARVAAIVAAVAAMLRATGPRIAELADAGFERVVYLGSGAFKALAREAALKLLELSDGRVVTAFDTPMGFRHGPKTIVTGDTLVVVFVSNDPLTRRYDLDLIAELRDDGRSGAVLAVAATDVAGDALIVAGGSMMADADLLFPYIVPAQLFALQVSLALGLTPDQPNRSGTVSRVVKGVRIHQPGA